MYNAGVSTVTWIRLFNQAIMMGVFNHYAYLILTLLAVLVLSCLGFFIQMLRMVLFGCIILIAALLTRPENRYHSITQQQRCLELQLKLKLPSLALFA
jgi:hypothetical protein